MHVSKLEHEVAPESTNGDQQTVEVVQEIEERVQVIDLPIYVVHRMLSSHANSWTQEEEDWRTNIFHTRVAHKAAHLM